MRKKLQHLKHRVVIPLFMLIALLTQVGADLSFAATAASEEAGFLRRTTTQNWADNGHRVGHGPIESRDNASTRRRVAPQPPPPTTTTTTRPRSPAAAIGARKEVRAEMVAVDFRAVNSIVRCYRLYNRCSERFVRIYGRRVDANAREKSIYGELRLESRYTDTGKFTIQGMASQSYLCFNKTGKLILKHSARDRSCHFNEIYTQDHYSEFESVANRTWAVGFGSKGRRLPGDKWTRSQKDMECFKFLKVPLEGGCDGRVTDPRHGPRPWTLGPHHLQHRGVPQKRSLLKT